MEWKKNNSHGDKARQQKKNSHDAMIFLGVSLP